MQHTQHLSSIVAADLHRALDKDEFTIFYHPVIDLQNGRLSAFEALLRWNRPDHGLISPHQFLDVANESGLIVPIGNWVLRTACQQIRTWQSAFNHLSNLGVSVNFSHRQFIQSELVETVNEIVFHNHLDPECVFLEFTEETLMVDAAASIGILRRLRVLGVQVAIDDFGLGYSSMGNLPRLPVNILKIDRSLIAEINSKPDSLRCVQMLLNIGKTLRLKAIAEGVETVDQDQKLKELNCDFAQGYYYSRPMPASVAEAWILNQQIEPVSWLLPRQLPAMTGQMLKA